MRPIIRGGTTQSRAPRVSLKAKSRPCLSGGLKSNRAAKMGVGSSTVVITKTRAINRDAKTERGGGKRASNVQLPFFVQLSFGRSDEARELGVGREPIVKANAAEAGHSLVNRRGNEKRKERSKVVRPCSTCDGIARGGRGVGDGGMVLREGPLAHGHADVKFVELAEEDVLPVQVLEHSLAVGQMEVDLELHVLKTWTSRGGGRG